ncbi:unnamed protein product [Ilex paraguariensis]|uniref:Uncharacterized protein n=1 Tax=Ilex paraguariensis TaxID=185542 RepID=A0ABC8UVM1_9AQUA
MASSDNYLWQLQYNYFFSDSDNTLKLKVPTSGRMLQNTEFKHLEVDDIERGKIGWRDAFKSAYKGVSSKKFTYRGYCRRCDAIVWLTNIRYSNGHCRPNCENRQIKPLSNQQIVDYIVDDLLTVSSSDSDSDSDEVSTSKLWAYPRRISKQ